MITENQPCPEIDNTKVLYHNGEAVYLSECGSWFIYKVAYDLGAATWPLWPVNQNTVFTNIDGQPYEAIGN